MRPRRALVRELRADGGPGAPRRIRPPDDPAAAAGRLPPAWALAHYTGPIRAAVLAGKEKGRRDLPPRLERGTGGGRAAAAGLGGGARTGLVGAGAEPPVRRPPARGDPVRAMATAAARTVAAAGRACGVAPAW